MNFIALYGHLIKIVCNFSAIHDNTLTVVSLTQFFAYIAVSHDHIIAFLKKSIKRKNPFIIVYIGQIIVQYIILKYNSVNQVTGPT